MRFPFKAVAIGVVAGIALFFFPFLFRVLIIVFFISLAIRFMGGFWWRRRWNDYPHRAYYGESFEDDAQEIIPVDGSRYVSSIHRRNQEMQFRIK